MMLVLHKEILHFHSWESDNFSAKLFWMQSTVVQVDLRAPHRQSRFTLAVLPCEKQFFGQQLEKMPTFPKQACLLDCQSWKCNFVKRRFKKWQTGRFQCQVVEKNLEAKHQREPSMAPLALDAAYPTIKDKISRVILQANVCTCTTRMQKIWHAPQLCWKYQIAIVQHKREFVVLTNLFMSLSQEGFSFGCSKT